MPDAFRLPPRPSVVYSLGACQSHAGRKPGSAVQAYGTRWADYAQLLGWCVARGKNKAAHPLRARCHKSHTSAEISPITKRQ